MSHMSFAGDATHAGETEMRLAVLVVQLADSVKQALRQVSEDMGLSVAQLDVLRQLSAQGPTPMSRLAESLHCEASNLTGLVDRLEARFLVERQLDPTDRRVRVLAVTDVGTKVEREAWIAFSEACPLRGLTPHERHEMALLLAKGLKEEIPEIP